MRIHHVNCGTMRPWGGQALLGSGRVFGPAELVCHVIIIETSRGLVVVDTGFGSIEKFRAARTLERRLYTAAVIRPQLTRDNTLLRHIHRLGFSADDVSDIILTHLDFDHAGGLSDFPRSAVHVHGRELDAALVPQGRLDRLRYWQDQFAHGPRWQPHTFTKPESWFGFPAVFGVADFDNIALISLPGHTVGHVGVAIRVNSSSEPERWLLHCGDASLHHGSLTGTIGTPPGIRAFAAGLSAQKLVARRTLQQLRELAQNHTVPIDFISAHDPADLAAMQSARDTLPHGSLRSSNA